MTEGEWLVCEDPQKMLDFLRGKVSDRKLRLFACSWCRSIMWHLLTDELNKKAVEIAEAYADGICGRQSLSVVRRERGSDYRNRRRAELVRITSEDAAENWACAWDAVTYTLSAEAHESASLIVSGWMNPYHLSKRPQNREYLVALLREIFGNCFQLITLDASWLTSTVSNLAQVIYDDRAFDRMPILADALEDAGCTNQDILSHCRSGGEHVRGCWVVDLILSKDR